MGSRGSSVIVYIVINENCMDIVKNFYVNERTDSDHMSLSLEIEEEDYIRNKKEKEEDNREEVQDIQERRKKTY